MNFRRKPLTVEFQLLVECCRSGFAQISAVRTADLMRCANWDRFVALSRRHRVQGLVWQALRDSLDEAAADAASALSQDASSVIEQNLRAADLSRRLAEGFSAAGLPLLFVKGLTLSKLAYGDPFLKMGWDVDILVPRETITEAAAQLRLLGLDMIAPADRGPDAVAGWHRRRKESIWRTVDGLHLELHTGLADSRDLIPGIGFGSARQQVEIAPRLTLTTLAPGELFAYLCVHGASSAWFRLKWISDLAALVHPLSIGAIEHLYDEARSLGAHRSADQALLLASQIFEIDVGPSLTRRLREDPASCWLADRAWNLLMEDREPTQVRFGTVPIHMTQLFLREGATYKIREAARQMRDWASPAR